MGRNEEAVQLYERAASVASSPKEKWLALARRHRFAGDWQKAKQAYLQVLTLEPQNEDALSGVGLAFQGLGQDAAAIEWYEQAVSQQPQNDWLWGRLVDAYFASGNEISATDAVCRWLRVRPDSQQVPAYLGKLGKDSSTCKP